MRQRIWMEALKDYDFELSYHSGKANMVAYDLSMKYFYMSALMIKEMDLIDKFRDLNFVSELKPKSMKLGMLKVTNNVLEDI